MIINKYYMYTYKGFIWQCIFNFHQNKNIFNKFYFYQIIIFSYKNTAI